MIKTCDYEFGREWDRISTEAKDFVQRLIEPNLKRRLSAEQALEHPWFARHVIKTKLDPKVIKSLLKHVKLTDFQHLCMLVLCEVLSLADHGFVTQAQQQFFAVNKSLSGEICFVEFRYAMLEALSAAGENLTEKQIKEAYDTVDRDLSDDVAWSEWQVALAYNSQLSEKNLRNVYQFLNLKKRPAMKLKHLHSALKPHI